MTGGANANRAAQAASKGGGSKSGGGKSSGSKSSEGGRSAPPGATHTGGTGRQSIR